MIELTLTEKGGEPKLLTFEKENEHDDWPCLGQ